MYVDLLSIRTTCVYGVNGITCAVAILADLVCNCGWFVFDLSNLRMPSSKKDRVVFRVCNGSHFYCANIMISCCDLFVLDVSNTRSACEKGVSGSAFRVAPAHTQGRRWSTSWARAASTGCSMRIPGGTTRRPLRSSWFAGDRLTRAFAGSNGRD